MIAVEWGNWPNKVIIMDNIFFLKMFSLHLTLHIFVFNKGPLLNIKIKVSENPNTCVA